MANFRGLMACGVLLVGGVLSTHSIASDEFETQFGSPNEALPEYAEFSYMRGDWDAQMVSVDGDGNRTELANTAHVTGYYHRDGKIFQSCFATNNFFSTDIRAFDTENAEWRAHFLNANAQRWNGFTIKKLGETMQTIVPGGFSGKEAFDVKTVVSEITENGFQSKVYASSDDGETWRQTFELIYTRADAADGVRVNC